MTLWFDPVPLLDDDSVTRVRFGVTTGCPNNLNGVVGVESSGADLRTALLSAGLPPAGLLCQYSAADPVVLLSSNQLSAARAATGRPPCGIAHSTTLTAK